MKSLCALSLLLIAAASAEATTVVLHHEQLLFGGCDIDDPCRSGGATVNIEPQHEISMVYVMLRNYENGARGTAFAFDVDSSWVLAGFNADCLRNQLDGWPGPPWGPDHGALYTSFDCITGGESAIVGRFHFFSMPAGCMSVIEASHQDPIAAILTCDLEIDPIAPLDRGRVCVGEGGVDTCEPATTPVRAATWGAIKGAFQ